MASATESSAPARPRRAARGEHNGQALTPLVDASRVPPQSMEAEQGLIGSILLAPDEWIDRCVEQIDEKAFYFPAHQTLFALMVELRNAGKPVDFISLTQALRDRSSLELVGGPAAISQLQTCVPTAANAGHYLEIVREKSVLRQIISVCTECASMSYDPGQEANAVLDDVERRVFEIAENRHRSAIPGMKDHVMKAIHSIEELYDRRGEITGLPTGFRELDKLTNGLHGSEMFVIAARPSMGKTALAMNIAEHVALHAKKAVAIFSLEMSTASLVQRLLCSNARVSMSKIRDGFLSERDFPNLTAAASRLHTAPMYIDDTSGLPILELRAKARRLKSLHDIQLIVIDYLQLLRSPTKRAQDNRQLEVSEISAGIKALAKELDIPIIVLAQLNRQPEARTGGRPLLSHLRESGSIEQDADVVGLLVRSEYYADDEEEKAEKLGEAELIIAKQRNGPTGEVKLTFLKEFTRFEDRAPEPREER